MGESRLNNIMPGTSRLVRITVGEELDVPISRPTGTIIFHPGEVIENENMLQIAEENNIYLIER
jgi:hypothetical protein